MAIYKEKYPVRYGSGYGGVGANIQIEVDEKDYIIDNDDITYLIYKEMNKNGFHFEQNKRQKYPRLKFGEQK